MLFCFVFEVAGKEEQVLEKIVGVVVLEFGVEEIFHGRGLVAFEQKGRAVGEKEDFSISFGIVVFEGRVFV